MLRLSWVPKGIDLNFQLALLRSNVLAAWEYGAGGNYPLGIVDFDVSRWSALPELANVSLDPQSPYPGASGGQAVVAANVASGSGAHGNYGIAYRSRAILSAALTGTYSGGYSDLDLAGAVTRLWASGGYRTGVGARVILCSGWAGVSGALSSACSAVTGGGGIVVTMPGPLPTTNGYCVDYGPGSSPANYANVVAVGGTMQTDEATGACSHWVARGFGYNGENGAFIYGGRGVGYDVAAVQTQRGPWGYKNNGTRLGDNYDVESNGNPAAVVAGIAHIVWSAFPNLTTAQMFDILTTCVDASRAGWKFSAYYPNARGIIDAEKCMVKAKSLANPNTVCPFLRVHGRGPKFPFQYYGTENQDEGVDYEFVNGSWRLMTHGDVWLEVGGYFNGQPLSSVDLILDGQTVYSGSPTSRFAGNLVQLTSYRNDYYDVRVIGHSSTGIAATRTYDADYASAPALNVVGYAPPQSLSGEAGGQGGSVAAVTPVWPVAGTGGGAGAGSASLTVQPPLAGSSGGHASASASLSQASASPKRLFVIAGGDGVSLTLGAPVWNVTGGDAKPLGIGIYPSSYYGSAVALSGAASAHAGATAIPGVVQGFVGTASGHAAGQGTIPVANPSAAGGGQGGGSATLSQAQPLSGEADGAAGATATGPQSPIPLAGVAEGAAAASGVEGVQPVAAHAHAHAGATATLTQQLPLSAQAQGQASAQAAPDRPVVIAVMHCALYLPTLHVRHYLPTLKAQLYRPALHVKGFGKE